jgi:hypothetical protein
MLIFSLCVVVGAGCYPVITLGLFAKYKITAKILVELFPIGELIYLVGAGSAW